jgi:hypothetical protein
LIRGLILLGDLRLSHRLRRLKDLRMRRSRKGVRRVR